MAASWIGKTLETLLIRNRLEDFDEEGQENQQHAADETQGAGNMDLEHEQTQDQENMYNQFH